ncbi:MAG: hypothetical protein P1V51_00565 [Deltaproteobacteria bacterium]|nr:hypothetical protein [Deltaproteobacteria bacterium]
MGKRKVKGILFVDYVRMLRARKDIDWSERLAPEDHEYLGLTIDPDEWYRLDVMEQLGLALLETIPGDALEQVRLWGRVTADSLVEKTPALLVRGDPRESLMRLLVHQASYFDFTVFRTTKLVDTEIRLAIGYGMEPKAEEAAATQAMGFFTRLLELAGAGRVEARFFAESWRGDTTTLLVLDWR